jgi:hypothetical protein
MEEKSSTKAPSWWDGGEKRCKSISFPKARHENEEIKVNRMIKIS